MDFPKKLSGHVADSAVTRSAEVIYRNPEPLPQIVDVASSSGLVEYWRVVVRHKGTVLLLIVLGALAGFLYTLPDTPIYRAHTTIEVLGLNENFLNMKDVNPTGTMSLDPSMDILTLVKLIE